MKKTYINPTIEVVTLHTSELLSNSTFSRSSAFGEGSGGTNDNGISIADSRYADDLWDDDEY